MLRVSLVSAQIPELRCHSGQAFVREQLHQKAGKSDRSRQHRLRRLGRHGLWFEEEPGDAEKARPESGHPYQKAQGPRDERAGIEG